MKQIKHSIYIGIYLLCTTLAFVSCIADNDGLKQCDTGEGLKFSVWIGDEKENITESKTKTVPSEANLNEDLIKTLDIFIFDKNNDIHHYNFTGVTSGETHLLEKGQDWRSWYTKDTDYPAYAIANYKGSTDLSTITTIEGLEALKWEENDIYKVYNGSANPNKSFLMDAEGTLRIPEAEYNNPLAQTVVEFSLKRAAAKIQLNIALAEKLTGELGFVPSGAYSWKFVNYVSNTTVLESGDPLTNLERQTTGYNSHDWQEEYKGFLTTYSYFNDWNASPLENATYILLNIPGTIKQEGQEDEVKETNYYKIPITAATAINRNYIYTVNATINSLGSYTEIVEEEEKIDFETAPWGINSVTVDVPKFRYLTVSPTEVILRNVASTDEVKYYSSHEVEIVGVSAFYFDKNGNKQPVTSEVTANINTSRDRVQVKLNGEKNGYTDLYSPLPTNLSVRYIEYTIRHKDDYSYSKTVRIKQYPLEYVQFIEGWYSTRTLEDKILTEKVGLETITNWCSWEKGRNNVSYTNQGSAIEHKNQMTVSDTKFSSKVYNNGTIYMYTDNSSGSGNSKRYNITQGSSNNNRDNNRMYVVQITSTSDEYTVDYPLYTPHPDKDGTIVVDDSDANDKVVSPAFMLASQLGTTSSGATTSYVKDHCRTYREVGKDGTKFNKWRLPTSAEIKIIVTYQRKTNTVMDEVMKGQSYYNAQLKAITVPNHTGSSGSFIRCVRDITPAEIEAMEAARDEAAGWK